VVIHSLFLFLEKIPMGPFRISVEVKLRSRFVVIAQCSRRLGRSPNARLLGARTFAFTRDFSEVSKKLLVCKPKGIRSLLSQLDPERAFHRLLGPEVATFRRGRDDPGVAALGVQGGLRTSVLGDPRCRFELRHEGGYILSGQIGFESRPKAQRLITVKQANVFDAGVEAGPGVGIDEQGPDRFRRGGHLELVREMDCAAAGAMSSGHLIASNISIS
jgi:hypothetical protein